jgi:predicted nucleic acid-binding protein
MLIFDASTLILLARIELMETFLASVSTEIAIPREVEKECCAGRKTLDALMIQKAVEDSRIRSLVVKNKKLAAKLQTDFSLGNGEAEAIALALAEKAQLVAIDDKSGINACKLLGIPFATAAGILVRCREKDLITFSDALLKLALLTTYGRYKNSIIEDVRKKLEADR